MFTDEFNIGVASSSGYDIAGGCNNGADIAS
jgi:hypothetical protein